MRADGAFGALLGALKLRLRRASQSIMRNSLSLSPRSSGALRAAESAERLSMLWAARKLCTWGRSARTPCAFGAKPSQRKSGFSQINFRQESERRSAALASWSGFSRSNPSVIRDRSVSQAKRSRRRS